MQRQLFAPVRAHARVVLAADPPEPVAAFGDQDLPPAECCRVRKLRALPRLLLEPRSGVGEKLPSDVVLGVANPGVEAGADPAARVQVMEALLRRVVFYERGDGRDDG